MAKLATEIGSRIRAARNKSSMSQAEVADRIGLTQGGYSHLEVGDRLANLELLQRLSELFSVPISAFLPESWLIPIDATVTDPRLSELLAAWPELTETQRQALLGVLRGFRS